MPIVHVKLQDRPKSLDIDEKLPEILRTPSGTVLLEIQGVINVGETPLVRTELDLGSLETESTHEEIPIGAIDLSQVTEAGSPVILEMGKSQLLRGKVVKLGVPLAILEVSAATDTSDNSEAEVPVLDVITHKAVFSARPEPVVSKST